MTFLRWAGSKKQLLEVLASCWHASGKPTGRRYVEAFSGSAALFFRLQPSRALLVDVNAELQQCLQRVRSCPAGVSNALQALPIGEEAYYQVRQLEPALLDFDERAARFIYLNRFCFNGLYRTNAKGHFNVPYGASRSGQLPSLEDLQTASTVLRRAKLVTGDFYECLLPTIGTGDFVYMDPPYAKRNVDLDLQYGPDVFGVNDLNRLSDLLYSIDEAGADFVVSYADCPEIRPIARHWTSHKVSVQRSIAANVASRGRATELLITNI